MDEKIVLLVEDNPDDEIFIIESLRKNNLIKKIVVAHNGAEALDILFNKGAETQVVPALILLDLKLPKVFGLEVLQRIRADNRTKFVPVVIFTSSKESNDLFNSYNLGANSYVIKPVDFNIFTDTVQQLAHYWLTLNESLPTDYGDTK